MALVCEVSKTFRNGLGKARNGSVENNQKRSERGRKKFTNGVGRVPNARWKTLRICLQEARKRSETLWERNVQGKIPKRREGVEMVWVDGPSHSAAEALPEGLGMGPGVPADFFFGKQKPS